jgi:hypothetical protein
MSSPHEYGIVYASYTTRKEEYAVRLRNFSIEYKLMKKAILLSIIWF